jgi:hypothetical protein
MKLTDKGDIRPPPILTGPAQRVSREIQSWPKIVAATHWYLHDRTQVDGADFYVGERELGHIHLDGEIHLGTTKALRAALIEQRLAEPFEWHEAWVQFSIRSKADAEHALWLFRLAYDRLSGANAASLKQRVAECAVLHRAEA